MYRQCLYGPINSYHSFLWSNLILCLYNVDTFNICMKKFGFFCSGIQFNLLLSPYPCFISLLYLDLYVLGDDALIS